MLFDVCLISLGCHPPAKSRAFTKKLYTPCCVLTVATPQVIKGVHVQEEILKTAAEAAVQRREAAEATATPDERIAIQHAKAAKAKELRKKEVCKLLMHKEAVLPSYLHSTNDIADMHAKLGAVPALVYLS